MKSTIWLAVLVSLLLLGDQADAQEPTQPLPDGIERTDLLTFAQGVLFVGQTGLAAGSAGSALQAIDGNSYRMGLSSDRQLPVEFVYKLPADTTFDRFAIPGVVEQPGNVTFVKSVTVSGSSESADSAYEVLASFELETHGPDQQFTEIVPVVVTPVRWIKVTFDGGINIEEGHEGRTVIWFSELIGNGTQEVRPLSTACDGVWDLRLTERTDRRGTPLTLRQDGTTITGCYDDIRLRGTVNGAIARATGEDSEGRRPSAFIFVAAADGTVQASVSVNKGRFGARTAVIDPDLTSTPCSDAPPDPIACGTNVYVNFDVDSAVIRPESEQVLADAYRRLVDEGAGRVSIEGHTSTEGTDDYNLDLSARRAQAVVDDLVARGFDAGSIAAVGKGESEPLVTPDREETARTLNRRVEIKCE